MQVKHDQHDRSNDSVQATDAVGANCDPGAMTDDDRAHYHCQVNGEEKNEGVEDRI